MARIFTRIAINSKFSSFIFLSKTFCSQPLVNPHIHDGTEKVPKLSTLFVPSRYGAEVYQIVKPLIDIDYIANNLEAIKISCYHRGINIDLDNLLLLAEEWLNMKKDYSAIVERDQECISKLSHSTPIALNNELHVANEKRNKILEKLLVEKKKLHDIEDVIMPLFQKVPHVLHPLTPLQFNTIDLCKEPPVLNMEVKSHVDIAKHFSMLNYTNHPSISYFMTGKLSELEFAIQMYFIDKLTNFEFYPMSCMDFCKSFIIEAIGYDPYSSLDCIQIKEKGNRQNGQKLHLVGGASFETFCAYLTNMNVNKSTLPIKYFSLGRRYNATNKESNLLDLFSVVQSTNVHCLILSESCSYNAFDVLLESIVECYSELNIPFRIVTVAAKNLTTAESWRKQVELWSPSIKDYVPIAYVSQHDDFISKRLQITYGIEYIKEGYCHVVEGAIVSIPILMGCLIENFQTKHNDFNIPNVLKKYLFVEK